MKVEIIINAVLHFLYLIIQGKVEPQFVYDIVLKWKREKRDPTIEEINDIMERAGLPHERIQKS